VKRLIASVVASAIFIALVVATGMTFLASFPWSDGLPR
jgi:hypothetical protein